MPMRQLQSCDFCGGDAAGVYEALPPELSPTEAEQRRLVLCADCAGTLETVVDPLLDRLGVETGGDASTTDAEGPADRSGPTASPAPNDATGNGGVDDRGPDRAERRQRDDEGDVGTAGNPAGGRAVNDEAESGTDGPARPSTGAAPADDDPGPVQWGDSGPADEGANGSGAPPSEPVRNGIPGIEPSDDADSGGAEPDAEAAAADDGNGAEREAVDASPSGTETDAAAGGADEESTDSHSPADEPEEFRTVMRLLGNREFPVERDDIVELAASAYELDEGHVHRILDHAVDRGVIADDAGTLRRN